jgi:hypothetical protein
MLITETVELGGRTFRRNYSDVNKIIHKIGTDELYCEAYDLPEKDFIYEETDIEIETEAVEE